jgi:hypothetical protein
MEQIPHRKRVALIFWSLMSIAAGGFSFFQTYRKIWSLPVALLLSLAAGIVFTLAIFRLLKANDRATRKKESHREKDAGNTRVGS